jgi:hypothetical protein
MSKPIPDKAEIMVENSGSFSVVTFERPARFDAHFHDTGASILLDAPGGTDTGKSVHVHVHYALLADVLSDLAKSVAAIPAGHAVRRKLAEAAKALNAALAAAPATSADRTEEGRQPPVDDIAQMSPEEEVLLLHVME